MRLGGVSCFSLFPFCRPIFACNSSEVLTFLAATVCVCVCMCECVYVCVYMYVCACMHACMYVYVCMHDACMCVYIVLYYIQATKPEHAVIRVWEVESWKQLPPLPYHTLTVTHLTFSHSSHLLLATSRDRCWSLWKRNDTNNRKRYMYM